MNPKLLLPITFLLLALSPLFAQEIPEESDPPATDSQSKEIEELKSQLEELKTQMKEPKAAAPAQPQAKPTAKAANPCAQQVAAKKDFDAIGFITKLPITAAEIKVKCKTSFTCPKDDKMTDLGMNVGCVKALPEDPNKLKDAGLDMAKGILAVKLGINENEIPSDLNGLKSFLQSRGMDTAGGKIDNGIDDSEQGGFFTSTKVGIAMATIGTGFVIYGIACNSKVKDLEKEYKNSLGQEARSKYSDLKSEQTARNISYGIGSGLLAVGLGVTIFF